MTNVKTQYNDFDAQGIRGPRVTQIKKLTVGRWYIIQAGRGEEVHAKFTGVSKNGEALFEVEAGDKSRSNLSSIIYRTAEQLESGFRRLSGLRIPSEVFKFKTHPDKLTVAVPALRKLVPMADKPYSDIPVGTLFEVLPNPGRHVAGSIYQLKENDGSSCPYFKLVSGKGPDDGDDPTHICCSWHRLAKIEEAEPEAAPEPVLHEIDQIKSEIDALMANAAAKRDEAAGLQLAAGKMETEAEALRQKLADSLSGYLPKKPIPFRSF